MLNQTLKWVNLKLNKCPKCNRDWLIMGNANFEDGMISCKCEFKIAEKRMSMIVSDMVKRGLEAERHNYEGFADED